MVKPLEWKACNVPDLDELVLIAEWSDAGYEAAVYAHFFEPRCFYKRTPYSNNEEHRHHGRGISEDVMWEVAEMDRPTL
jgi:hypothetical protein